MSIVNTLLRIRNLALVLLVLFLSCTNDRDEYYEIKDSLEGDFISTLKSNGCRLFAESLESENYDVLLSEARPFTIMAPKDEAFSQLISGMNKEELKRVLLFHLFDGSISSKKLTTGKELYSVSKKKVTITGQNTFEGYNGDFGGIETKDLEVSNGFIHVLQNVFVPSLSLGERLAEDYPKFGEFFNFFSTVDEGATQGISIINTDGHSDVILTGLVKYDFINPFDESVDYTVLPFTDQAYNDIFGELESILRGNAAVETEKRNLFKQFLPTHIYPGIIDSTALVDGINKNFNGIPTSIPEGAIKRGNITTSNGIVHEMDTVLFPVGNVLNRIAVYYKTTQFNLGDPNDLTLSTSSRSNNTNLAKENDLAIWTVKEDAEKEGGYLFFTLPKELAAAKYKMYIEHEVDSGSTDLVSVTVNDKLINAELNYDDSTVVIAGTPINLIQEVGIVDFDTYQTAAKVRFDIVEERFGDNLTKNDTILKILNIKFEPWKDE